MPIYIGNKQVQKIYHQGKEKSAKSLGRLYFSPGGSGLFVDIFAVGGGGGGGGHNNLNGVYPGGGAGGYTNTYSNISLNSSQTYLVEVGAGGSAGYADGTTSNTGATPSGGNGASSSFDAIYSADGGGGGYEGYEAGNGGSGGGRGSGGAGGTDGGDGGAATDTYGLGQGTTTREFGHTTTTLYAGGGGSGRWSTATPGGAGGGGNGYSGNYGGGSPINGTDNLGGGGGGNATYPSSTGYGGTGGSGIVKVRYESDTYKAYGGEMQTSGSYKMHTFNTSGEFTVGTLTTMPSTNLVVHYDAGNTSSYPGTGTTVTDLQGNVNGTLSGATYDSADGGSFLFGADGDHISLGSNTLDTYLEGSVNFSVGFWVNMTTHGYLLDQGNFGSDATGCFEFRSNFWGRNNDSNGWGVTPGWSGTTRDPINRGWHFISGTKNGSTATLYLDGMITTQETESSTFSGSGLWKIGRRAYNTSSAYGGRIGQVFIYSSALTPTQMMQLYVSTNRY